MTKMLTLQRPDDLHLHLRDVAILALMVAETANHFDRALIMPNLVPTVTTSVQAATYRD
tara:strand:- start:24 stop:200 length:177 start_codon:yes stop_codon:yes gene_type:complete